MSKRRKKKGVWLIVLIVAIVSIILYICVVTFTSSASKVVDKIEKYNYTLDNRDTSLMQETFQKLKDILSREDIDYEAYAKYLSSLFIIDLYTLDNKINKYDVGGVEYIYKDHQSNFKLNAQDTLYRYLEDENNRKQKLPEVKSIEVVEIKSTKFTYKENSYDAFELSISWTYQKDLGYDTRAKVTIFKVKDKLYVGTFTTEVSK